MKIEATIIADSINTYGDRLTTMVLTYPRIIHSEVMTHRMFSRNSASSRAIPFEKMVKSVEENPFIPIAWQKDHKGMQGTEYFNDAEAYWNKDKWLKARDYAVKQATLLHKDSVTKQLCNRLLEPFMWHTVLVTATEFENFFDLRCPKYEYKLGAETYYFKSWKDLVDFIKSTTDNSDYINGWENETSINKLKINTSQAEIHIQALAEAMWDAYNESKPKQLQAGKWHIPFGDNINTFDFTNFKMKLWENKQAPTNGHNDLIVKISTARCARVSYTVVGEEGKEPNYDNDLKLHDRLLESGHFSPFEHCARVMTDKEYESFVKAKLTFIDEIEWYTIEEPLFKEKGWCNNFKGFIPYRYLIDKK
jgi:thymidylate synthase ThyX